LNAIFNLPRPAQITLVIIIGLLFWWLFGSSEETPLEKQTDSVIDRTSDYSMTDFTMTVMNEQGIPARVIQGKTMHHYPSDDSTVIRDPITEFIEAGKDTWVVTANKGHTQGKGETILLTENVIITNKQNPAFNMHTEKLTLDNEYNSAYTDDYVLIRSPKGDTESIGLHVDLNDETINLHSRVKGQYDAPAS
jgi:lipopolysaccharide export system protein LptC